MKRKIGTVCMVLGAALVVAALSLFLWNRYEDIRAGKSAGKILPGVVEQMERQDPALPDPYDPEMAEAEIDGYLYVGVLTIPAIGLELPVMSSWSYPLLKISPCRYSGSAGTDDLVVCAHNYDRHFGKLKNLSPGDEVCFTEMDGVVSAYTVATVETLPPDAVEEMTGGDYDLTLFTCTYGGAARVTVRCERITGEKTERN